MGNLHSSSVRGAILNEPKVQSMVKRAMESFKHACPSGKWPMKSACQTGKPTSPGLLDTVFVEPCTAKPWHHCAQVSSAHPRLTDVRPPWHRKVIPPPPPPTMAQLIPGGICNSDKQIAWQLTLMSVLSILERASDGSYLPLRYSNNSDRSNSLLPSLNNSAMTQLTDKTKVIKQWSPGVVVHLSVALE